MTSMSSSTYNSRSDTVVEPWKPTQTKRRQRATLPELLRLRETHGLSQQRRYRGYGYGSAANPNHIASKDYLSYRGAWNPTRMQNTILVVGPGTPASSVKASSRKKAESSQRSDDEESNSTSSNADESDGSRDEDEELELENNNDDGMDEGDEMEEDEDEEEEDDDDDGASSELYRYMHFGSSEDDSASSDDDSTARGSSSTIPKKNFFPSMRHGGCINTAAWLTSDCGWRLSTKNGDDSGIDVVETEELPTQVATSGDDRLLKIWDVSEAMGSVSPLAGGTATFTPFSSYRANDNLFQCREHWQSIYDSRCNKRDRIVGEYRPPGTVRLLATVSTGHRGNVFHITPLKGRRGTFATCGADGFLRLVDVERSSSGGGGTRNSSGDSSSSTAVIHPMYDHNSDGNPHVFDPENPLAFFLRNSSGMCFSHTMLDDANVGLLCSEKGLLRFDFRLSPREQSTRSLLPRTVMSSGTRVRSFLACKACTVLRTDSGMGSENSTDGGSTYVFAGGSSPSVALCDLRMTAASSCQRSSNSRVLQYFKPVSLSEENHVSVSGLDLSRDGKELLVSYESDQIYTFPVFPHSQSPRRAATDQLEELLNKDSGMEQDGEEERLCPWGQGKRVLPELASYGAHLNRFTFLKNARYAGPRDEYICTGSDSGHAWVYEKASGAVVSFWKADQSTCNGVVPHPTLPIFVTYGIDSTAKLWRATTPVDSDVDDSAIGRRKHFRMTQERYYKMTPTVRNWGEVKSILTNLDLREAGGFSAEPDIYPDQIPCSKVMLHRGRLARTWFRESSGSSGGRLGVPKIGNDLQNLPDALKGNLYTVLRSLFDDDDVPVESDIDDFKQRISLIRLRHQADSLGLTWNPTIPWMLERQSSVDDVNKRLEQDSSKDGEIEPSELVPEYPSDWIPYDAEMSTDPSDFKDYFGCKSNGLYTDFYRDRYYALDERGIMLTENGKGDSEYAGIRDNLVSENNVSVDMEGQSDEDAEGLQEEARDSDVTTGEEHKEYEKDKAKTEEILSDCKNDFARHSDQILAETIKILKDGGNAAFKAGKLGLAAYRYDKAIQYGSVAYMSNRKSNLLQFNALLKNLIMTRLNMALVMLNAHFMELQVATKQAKLALQEVSPFCDPGKIENRETLDEALALKAKACFRLGSVQYEMGDYSDSIQSLEESIKCTNDISNPKENTPDPLVLKRLAQANREQLKHAKRQRKKFKFAFTAPSSQCTSETESKTSKTASPSSESETMSTSPRPTNIPGSMTIFESSGVNVEEMTHPSPIRNTANNVTPMNSPALEAQTGILHEGSTKAPSLPAENEQNNV